MLQLIRRRFFHLLLLSIKGLFALVTIWVAISLISVRVFENARSEPPDELQLRSEVVFDIAAQASRIVRLGMNEDAETTESEQLGAAGSLTRISGMPLAFTNEHVARSLCEADGFCRFEERGLLDPDFRSRKFKLRVCHPGWDLCALSPADEEFNLQELSSASFASVSVGETVYAIDWRESGYMLLRERVIELDGPDLILEGYGRNGFSGSPLFNNQGKIVGIIKQLDGSRLLNLPHYAIFGWSQSRRVRAIAGGDWSWIAREREELVRAEWNRRQAILREKYQSAGSASDPCSSTLGAWVVAIKALWLTASLDREGRNTPLEALFREEAEEFDAEAVCRQALAPEPERK